MKIITRAVEKGKIAKSPDFLSIQKHLFLYEKKLRTPSVIFSNKAIKRMISVVNDDAEFDKRSDKIEEKARVSTDEAIGSRNEDNKLSLGVSDE
ncbi:Tudor/PWWP/MBT superfamily protein [Gossypium australe]|uniref:Tudor/PWWP/MBT superfamily protein n=1 Tax=Gossypium australe TaxID=47621 RepID=A0A5B6WWS9_9ROSI|nr:Tudor/PWWP/MBT superfamily protein [Gossypium australe]